MSNNLKEYTTSNDDVLGKIGLLNYFFNKYPNIFGNLGDFQERAQTDKKTDYTLSLVNTLLIKNQLRITLG